jgi:hypothetical protein
MAKLSTAQIGRSGELLVQYRMLKWAVESAPLTTDTGVDLVAFSPTTKQAITIQVKTNERPKPSGGKGRHGLDWWLREDSPADLVALVDLDTDRVWLFRHDELASRAQQRSGGKLHFYFYVDLTYTPNKTGRHISEFDDFAIEKRMGHIFGISETDLSNSPAVLDHTEFTRY